MYKSFETRRKQWEAKFLKKYGEKYKIVEGCDCMSQKIVCPDHGELIAYRRQLLECACVKCKREQTCKDYINRLHKKFGTEYEFVTDMAKQGRGRISSKCVKHGLVPLLFSEAIRAQKPCPRCNIPTYNTDSFIQVCKSIHGNTYCYDKTVYESMRKKVIITCKTHGDFLVKAAHHIRGSKTGCPLCFKGRQVSKVETEFLDYVGVPKDCRNVKVGKYNVDGIIDDTVYEFYGDLFHGHPNKRQGTKMKPKGMTLEDLFIETDNKAAYLSMAGYNVRYCWETDWNQFRNGFSNVPVIRSYDGLLRV